MDASGTTPDTDTCVYYVIGRHSGYSSTSEFPYLYSAVRMTKTEAEHYSCIEKIVRGIQDLNRTLLLANAARGNQSQSTRFENGTQSLGKFYSELNNLYVNNKIYYIRTTKPHQVGDTISALEPVGFIRSRLPLPRHKQV